jgi:hypothetical protein
VSDRCGGLHFRVGKLLLFLVKVVDALLPYFQLEFAGFVRVGKPVEALFQIVELFVDGVDEVDAKAGLVSDLCFDVSYEFHHVPWGKDVIYDGIQDDWLECLDVATRAVAVLDALVVSGLADPIYVGVAFGRARDHVCSAEVAFGQLGKQIFAASLSWMDDVWRPGVESSLDVLEWVVKDYCGVHMVEPELNAAGLRFDGAYDRSVVDAVTQYPIYA